MFEFLGIAFVAWVVWTIGKALLAGATKGTLLRAALYAQDLGVPRDFARELLQHPDVVKKARQELAAADRDFGALDVYEQYGKTIVHLHVRAREIEVSRLKNEVETVFSSQRDHDSYPVCSISALYVCTLVAVLGRMTPTAAELRNIFDHCFRHPSLADSRQAAWDDMMNSPHALEAFSKMGDVVQREVAAKKFQFFTKLQGKYLDNYQEGVSEAELEAADPFWYIKLA